VGLAVARAEPGRIEVDDLMLSCRVQGKFIEQALFAELVRRFQALEPRRLWVNYTPTARNTPAREVLDAIGFVDLGEGKGRELDLTTVRLECDFIHTSDS
jgi:predicted enzyme involved in methoxymalonyl-ACP biosynthesis